MRKSTLAIVAAAALTASAAVQAQFYVGGNVGLGNISIDCSDTNDCDKTATGFKAYGGYRFENGWAVEAGYFDWGKATASFTDDDSTVLSGSASANGFGIGLAYFMPFSSEWVGVFRFGAIQNRGKLNISDGTVTVSGSKSEIFAYGGLGVGYNLTPRIAITVEADFSRARWGAEGVYESENVQIYTIGLRYSF